MTSADLQFIRRLPSSVGSASAQLAAGSALLAGLEQTGLPALHWQRIDPPTLLLGSAQRLDEIDLAACAAAGVSVHRRGSGGGIVLSDATLLLLDLALPEQHPLFVRDVTESYCWLGEVWAAALRTLALDAWLVPVAQARADTQALHPLLKRVCFGGRSPYEVLVGDRKLVGLAQIRRRGGALFQAGIYLHWKPWATAALLSATADERAAVAARLGERVVGLDELVGGSAPDAAPVIAAVETALTRFVQLSLVDDKWRVEELSARTAALARYAAIG
jgi:lipoate---protein ligase